MQLRGKTARWASRGILVGLLAATLAGCGVHDEKAGLTRDDYEDLLARRGPEQARPAVEPPIPELQPVLAAPTPPDEADQRRVTISVTEQTPLRDVLIELARKAEVELELDPRIQGGVIFTARDRPFAEVARRIADLAGLRYTFQDNVLRMELDEPYTKTYRLDVLNLKRSVSSSIAANTDVFKAVGDTASGNNGSQAEITNAVESDFWTEVQDGITAIVGEPLPANRLVTAATASTAPPDGASPSAGAPSAGSQAAVGTSPQGEPAQIAQAQQIADTQAAAIDQAIGNPQTTGNPPPAPANGAASAAQGSSTEAGSGTAEGNGQYFTLNRQAGIVSVFATQRTQRKVADYIADLRKAIQGQVLIEAKVIEVGLNDQFRAGIDWNSFGIDDTQIQTNLAPADITNPPLTITAAPAALNFTATLNLLNQFGTTRTLSSPRLTVTNNETALLKVAENEVYFTISIESDTADNGVTTRTYESELNTVPIGFLMTVQPSINAEDQRVSLNLRPTISRIVRTVEDPAVNLMLADIKASAGTNSISDVKSTVPVVEVREMDSIVTMDSGSTLVMGGLMQERTENEEGKIPVAGDIPLIGNAFKNRNDESKVVELVVLIRATIVHDRDTVHPADVDLYNKFTPDPRPFGF